MLHHGRHGGLILVNIPSHPTLTFCDAGWPETEPETETEKTEKTETETEAETETDKIETELEAAGKAGKAERKL